MDLMYIRVKIGELSNTFDSGYLRNYEADIDISTDTETSNNDFEIKMALPESPEELLYAENKISTIIFAEGTEYGGFIMGSAINIEEQTITYTGRTWRGTLGQYIIEPPEGEDYRVVSGNLAETIRTLPKNPIITVKDTEYSGDTFQFDRYISTQEGVNKLLIDADPDLRFAMSFKQLDGEYSGVVEMEIVKTRNLSSLIEVSQDFNDKIGLTIKRDHNTPRHLICLGKGELHEREVIHLYADEDWQIQDEEIAGAYPVEIYDFSNSDTLESDGIKHFKELIGNHKQIDVSISDLDVRLGDVISARDHLTGENVQAEISNIVYKCSDYGTYKKESYEYKTKVRL